MRKVLGGVAALALAAASVSVAFGMPTMGSSMMKSSVMMPKCTTATGPVVWWMASSKTYYAKGAKQYGKGSGKYVCRAVAMKAGGKMGTTMSHGSMGGAMTHGSMGTGGGSMAPAMTMAPRPATTPGTMAGGSMGGAMSSPMASPIPGATPGVGIPGSTNAAPGSRSPNPAATGSMSGASGNQGNTGAPGAGGQVPNNPATGSNSSPGPSPSPRP